MSDLRFKLKSFDELTTDELYRIIRLRVAVFVVEQDCVYQDLDNLDKQAHHLIGYNNQNQIVAYTRLLAPGAVYDQYSCIGRVIVDMDFRKYGFGKLLMKESIELCKQLYPKNNIKISAQSYLLKFYNELGFQSISDEYLEDGIPHVGMIL